MHFSKPLKAPEATNRMLVVSTATDSPRNFRELRSGTLTVVPSSIFNNPCLNREAIERGSIQHDGCTY